MTRKLLIISYLSLLSIFLFTKSYGQFNFEYDSAVEIIEDNKLLKLAWAGGLNSGQYQTIDLDRDGIDDLVIFDRTSNKVNTFLWSADGYQYHPAYEALFPLDLNGWLIVADFNCDGIEDLFSSSVFGMKAYEGSITNSIIRWTLVIDPINTEGFSSQVNLQVNSADIPAIVDGDGDGDLDIFVFNFAGGETIEYHQNLSVENEGSCGLSFRRVTSIWGNFHECSCGVYSFGTDCSDIGGRILNSPDKILHAGGKALLLFDYDGDGDKDVLFGDEECSNLAFFNNLGSSTLADFKTFSLNFPDDDPSEFLFPAAYFTDVDHDGLKDLLIAPNLSNGGSGLIDFRNSSRFYKNIGTIEKPQFLFQEGNFLQQEMVDWGLDAAPALSDINKDGKIDLLVGNGGLKTGNEFYATIALYENTGSLNTPKFSLQSEDFLQLSALDLVKITPGFADINGDGFADIYFKGTTKTDVSSLYYIVSQSGMFSENSPINHVDVTISDNDKPVLGKINEDNFDDLLIFRSSGRVDYYENQMQTALAEFFLISDNFAGFTDRFENRNLTPSICDLDNDDDNELIISNSRGQLFVIENFLTHSSGLENSTSLVLENHILQETVPSNFGFGSNIAFAQLFSRELPSMIVGSSQGGLYFLRNKEGSENPEPEIFTMECFPNPTNDILTVKVSEIADTKLYNGLGKVIWENLEQVAGVRYEYDLSILTSGIYFVKATSRDGKIIVKKIIVL